MANLTMSEKCKASINDRIPLSFFLGFTKVCTPMSDSIFSDDIFREKTPNVLILLPQDVVARRTATLCLSELLEDPKNQTKVLEDPKLSAKFFKVCGVRVRISYLISLCRGGVR